MNNGIKERIDLLNNGRDSVYIYLGPEKFQGVKSISFKRGCLFTYSNGCGNKPLPEGFENGVWLDADKVGGHNKYVCMTTDGRRHDF